jgi:hypothetical protein
VSAHIGSIRIERYSLTWSSGAVAPAPERRAASGVVNVPLDVVAARTEPAVAS